MFRYICMLHKGKMNANHKVLHSTFVSQIICLTHLCLFVNRTFFYHGCFYVYHLYIKHLLCVC